MSQAWSYVGAVWTWMMTNISTVAIDCVISIGVIVVLMIWGHMAAERRRADESVAAFASTDERELCTAPRRDSAWGQPIGILNFYNVCGIISRESYQQ